MSVRNVKPAGGSNSIVVWDNKYSNGYRADFYLVVTPDGSARAFGPAVDSPATRSLAG